MARASGSSGFWTCWTGSSIKPSVALGTEAAKRYPELVDALLRRDACFMAHGDYAIAADHQPYDGRAGHHHRCA